MMNPIANQIIYRGTMTQMRHMAPTFMTGLLPEQDRKDLASLMAHSSGIQQKHYNKCLSSLKNIRISNVLFKLFSESQISAADLKKS